MEKRDYYEVLGVEKNASADELKNAYKKLALQWHPDKFGSAEESKKKEAEEKFKEINEAYSVLSDPEKKAQYDRFGHDAFRQGGPGAGGFGDINIDDIFASVFGGRGFGGFGNFGGFGRSQGSYAEPGEDLTYQIEITLEEAAFGVDKTIRYRRKVKCPVCGGTGGDPSSPAKTCPKCGGTGRIRTVQRTIFGQIAQEGECDQCHGSGKIYEKKCASCGGSGTKVENTEIKRHIPAGIQSGQRLLIRDMGEASEHGGPNGDLYIFVRVKKHKIFERVENDIFCQIPISYATAVLGGEVEVPVLNGTRNVKIPAGTQTGKKFKLRGEGITPERSGVAGDEIIEVIIETPVELTEEQKKKLKEFDACLSEKNYKKETWKDKIKNFFS
ncbi:MAG: molecular chaperone DnaJ [Fusobacteriaceae bacterium]|jgi:molecular chaperone DnaJ|nr:molecular chaperone DnaJ [Fusobacteriaceae bacterium]